MGNKPIKSLPKQKSFLRFPKFFKIIFNELLTNIVSCFYLFYKRYAECVL